MKHISNLTIVKEREIEENVIDIEIGPRVKKEVDQETETAAEGTEIVMILGMIKMGETEEVKTEMERVEIEIEKAGIEMEKAGIETERAGTEMEKVEIETGIEEKEVTEILKKETGELGLPVTI